MSEDEVARQARERWGELARAEVEYSRPWLDLDPAEARRRVDPEGQLPTDLAGREVLCLAAGGGQQSAAFALLGARVTVLDLTPEQLERDRRAAAHHGVSVETVQGDMRDLSRLAPARFDVVWQAHALNFVPDARPVLAEAARVLRPGGRYRLEVTNPFVHDGGWEQGWTGAGYLIRQPYGDGEVDLLDPDWTVAGADGAERRIRGPREFRHTLGTLVNGGIGVGLRLLGLWEDATGDPAAPPGSWAHFKAWAPPWITLWWERRGG